MNQGMTKFLTHTRMIRFRGLDKITKPDFGRAPFGLLNQIINRCNFKKKEDYFLDLFLGFCLREDFLDCEAFFFIPMVVFSLFKIS